ncbi:aminopeptidase N [Streptomyces sp. ST2-7A]|uniref:aminopeptidase N n=1 Tax=Streptomyces sp. ST2-7A TaxID=2907214 RepID=UPI001F480E60|nr:aminopeptidase N [Streptomyces sp. ST2-7A]MCE7082637.1 aminopeptidase N [Streptomyces sp. ST2-7A]
MSNSSAFPAPVRRLDYRPPTHSVESVDLTFELDPARTRVTARTVISPRGPEEGRTPLRLDGRDLVPESIRVNGREPDPTEYTLDAEALTLTIPEDRTVLEIVTVLEPKANTALTGLYLSGDTLLTQCEPEGFRRITYYPDRPDVLAVHTCTLIADEETFPVLLSNGERRESRRLADGRHSVTWVDPHPKPSYLFALVAGRRGHIETTHRTPSGREVGVRVYAEEEALPGCRHALEAVRKAMVWDEEKFGLEYDLDTYTLVSVDDFNMGAMENKGLNIFNSLYVQADPRTATDEDIAAIHTVVAHEYFHNWTGNRVTCRDMFQLSLKEGLAVYRDEVFTGDLLGRGVQRVRDVRALRERQFAEDAGPQAHPVRPDEYREISNFYTWTVYKKGAEVIRMLCTLFGEEGFREGLRLYLNRHDGQAATCDQFVTAMAEANDADLTQFMRWYGQAGTPVLDVEPEYDAGTRTYTLVVRQSCPPTPKQPHKELLHVPLRLALLGPEGRHVPLRPEGEDTTPEIERVFELRQPVTTLRFTDIPARPVPSLLRGFSAPVRLRIPLTGAERLLLATHDDDPFVRWESLQAYVTELLLKRYHAEETEPAPLPAEFIDVLRGLLRSDDPEPGLTALMLELPGYETLFGVLDQTDPVKLAEVLHATRAELAGALREPLLERYHDLDDGLPYTFDARQVGWRALKNTCLAHLAELDTPEVAELTRRQYARADNMTDRWAALAALADREDGEAVLEEFGRRWHDHPLVLDKWFALHARSRRPDTLDRVRQLTGHPMFSFGNPNRVGALIVTFCFENPLRFHAADGSGYAFAARQIAAVDRLNPQAAARLAGCFNAWRSLEPTRRRKVLHTLRDLDSSDDLSSETREIVGNAVSRRP